MNLKKMIGSRITQARKANGLTIKALAEKTNLGIARVGNWEQGTRSPGAVEAKVLSEALNVAGSWLLCLSDNPRGEWIEGEVAISINDDTCEK